MAGVPDTTTFKLTDVTAVVVPSSNNLVECFADAVAGYFDPTYAGSKDRLLNFRNYANEVPFDIVFDSSIDNGHVYYNGTNWTTCRTTGTGTTAYTTGAFECYVQWSSPKYYIYRTFLRFDLTSIPSGATCLSASLEFNISASYGSSHPNFIGVVGTHGTTLTTADYDAYTVASVLFGTWSTSPPEDPELYAYAIIADTAGQRSAIATYFGSYLYVALLNSYYDIGGSTPTDKEGHQIVRSGELAGPSVYITYGV